ncbi:hypothetical protein, partial [Streptomyces spectabilis]|uniref:hypothetical protein n=1 Tax=Streptomyces spectabilis TaxID=68270 RepID=UPI003478137B
MESLELNRMVLLDAVPTNAETWFQARAFRLAAARGVLGSSRTVIPSCDEHSLPDTALSLPPGQFVTGGEGVMVVVAEDP